MADIDKLSISFESDSTQAVEAIDNIVNALGRLNQGLNIDKGVATTINSLTRLDKIIAGLDNDKLDKFSKGIDKLSEALKPLANIEKSNLKSTLKTLSKIPETFNALDESALSSFEGKIKSIANAMTPLANKCSVIAEAFNKLPSAVSSASGSLDNYSNKSKKSDSGSKGLLSTLGSMMGKFGTLKTVILSGVNAFSNFFNESAEYTEQLNLFSVAMGSATESAQNFAQKVSDAMGIDPGEWMNYQGTLNMMIKGFGVASDKAQIMSQNLTQLSYDYSSLMNVDPSTAFNKISSAMSGQIKGLKEYGNNVSVAMVKQTGFKYGLQGNVSSWDQNTQAIMRYITIMDNASKVDVFNDMARTINTPSNAVRILTQQFKMLKRAIGNIASVFATAVIPYIQVAVDLLNKFANFIAGLFGFKLPKIDYSGISAGSDAMDDMADSTNNAGSAVDGTSKKVKNLKKELQTLGFDELNILNSPKDDSDSGGSGSGGGGGSGGGLSGIGDIPLPSYDFLKGLKKSAEEIEKKLRELFKPIEESWKMYGEGVMKSLKFSWEEIKKLVESVGKSFGEVWQNGTGKQTIDDILQIVTHLLTSVGYLSKRFREAWDSASLGTKIVQTLWDAFNKLLDQVVAISKLIEEFAFNIDFKPLLKSVLSLSKAFKSLADMIGKYLYDAFKNALLPLLDWVVKKAIPSAINSLADALKGVAGAMKNLRPLVNVIEKVVTVLAKMAGNAILAGINSLAKAIKAVGESRTLISMLTASISTLLTAMAVGKVVDDWKNLTGIVGIFKMAVMDVKKLGLAEAIRSWTQAFANSNSTLKAFYESFVKLNSATGILSGVSSVVTKLGSSLGVLTTAEVATAETTGVLGTVFTFLASNPLVAVIGAVGLVAGAVALFTSRTKDNSDAQEKAMRSATNLTNSLKEQAKEWKNANNEAKASADAGIQNVNVATDIASKLYDIVDASGKVTGSTELAQYYVDELNSRLGTNIEIHNGVIDNWDKEKEKINENIEVLKRKAVIEAYAEKFANADAKRIDAIKQLNKATEKYNKSKEKEQKLLVQINKQWSQGIQPSIELINQYHKQQEVTEKYGQAVNKAKDSVANITDGMNTYNSAMKAMDGTVESSTAFIVEQYGQMSKDGMYTFTSLANGLNDLAQKCDEHGKTWQTMSKTEQEASKQARNQLLSDLAQKAYKHGKTYSEMLATAKEKGAQLTANDKAELKKQYDNLTKHDNDIKKAKAQQNNTLLTMLDKYGIDKNSKDGKRYQKELEEAQKNGTKQGQQYIEKLAKKINDDSSKVSNETDKVGKKSKDSFEKHKADFKVDTKSATNILGRLLNSIPSFKDLKINLKTEKKKFRLGDFFFDIGFFANGGFPDSGQMFVAREAGPELVGRIGHKTAVVNNDQIIQGIASAVRSAMSGVGAPSGTTTRITVQNVLDGRKIGESVIEYHNGKVKQTGHSPLLF